MLTDYTSTKSGNRLERMEAMFFWRGRYFPGLVDVAEKALYDDPEDSFADHVGMQSALAQGLIKAPNVKVTGASPQGAASGGL